MNKNLILFIFVILYLSSSIVLEMPAPSFVSIEKFFGVSEVVVGLIVAYSLIGSFLGSLLYGPFSDSYGRRKILILGNLVLLIGSIGCSFSTSIEMLIFFRLVQGFGSACSLVLVPVIISDLYSVDEASRLYKITSSLVTAFTAGAPILGGFINDHLGWHENFLVMAIFSVISMIASYSMLETKNGQLSRISFGVIYDDYKNLLKNGNFIASSFANSLIYANFIAFLTYTPFLYMKVFGISASKYSMHQAIAVIFFSLSNFILSKFPQNMNIKFVKLGLFLSLFGSSLIYFFNFAYFITFCVCITAVGAAMTFPTLLAYSIASVGDLKGSASSFSVATRYLICGLVIYAVSNLYNGTNTRLAIFMSSISLVVLIMNLYLFKKKFFDHSA